MCIARWLHQGYPKKLASIQITSPHRFGPAPRVEASARLGATLAAAGRQLAQAVVTRREPAKSNGFVNAHPMAHHCGLPSVEKGEGLALDDLGESGAAFEGGQPWAADAEPELFEAPTEELYRLAIRKPSGTSHRQVGTPWDGGQLFASDTTTAPEEKQA